MNTNCPSTSLWDNSWQLILISHKVLVVNKLLYEDIIIESLKMYGQDVYYIPREIVDRDRIFVDDSVSRFDNAYKIEMYIENTEGF